MAETLEIKMTAIADKPEWEALRKDADDLREETECHYLGAAGTGRFQLLGHLRARGWTPCGDSEPWDLDRGSYRVLTTDEDHGPDCTSVRVRLLHPPGLRRAGLDMIKVAALEAGLEPL